MLTDIPQQPLGLSLGLAAAAWAKAWAIMLFPFRGLGSLSIVRTKTLARVAPVGLCPYWSSLPRVWSPLQGCTPWALIEVAPLELARLLLAFGASGWEGSGLVGEKFVLSALRSLYIRLGARLVYVGSLGYCLVRGLYIKVRARLAYVWGASAIILRGLSMRPWAGLVDSKGRRYERAGSRGAQQSG